MRIPRKLKKKVRAALDKFLGKDSYKFERGNFEMIIDEPKDKYLCDYQPYIKLLDRNRVVYQSYKTSV